MARGRRGEKQSYERLRVHHRQLGVPWTDNSFPANDSSIGLQKVSPEWSDMKRDDIPDSQSDDSMFQAREAGGGLEWRRVTDLSSRPRLVVEAVGREDAVPGSLASSWFVAAASVLAGAGASKLWERVIPDLEDQEWDYDKPERYRCT